MEGLADCIDTWYNKHGVDKSVLIEVEYNVIIKVEEKINVLSTKKTSGKYYKNVPQRK